MPGSRLGFADWEDPEQITSLLYTNSLIIKTVYLGLVTAVLWHY